MKTFDGTKIQRSLPLLDYDNQLMVYAGVEYIVLSSAKTSQATFYPLATD